MKRLLATIVFAALIGTASAAAQPPPPVSAAGPPVVVTTGEASIKRVPDRAWVSIAVETRARGPQEAQKMNATAMAAVLQKLKGAGLEAEAIRTTAYHLQPEFDYVNGKQVPRGYLARNMVEVRIDDIARVGEILDISVASGATTAGGVRFDLKDRSAVEREALGRAVADARARAEAAAGGAGMRIERVLKIEEQREFGREPRPMVMAMRQAAEVSEPPISPGEIEVVARVTLTVAIR
jgi:uncharacterized protein YggE